MPEIPGFRKLRQENHCELKANIDNHKPQQFSFSFSSLGCGGAPCVVNTESLHIPSAAFVLYSASGTRSKLSAQVGATGMLVVTEAEAWLGRAKALECQSAVLFLQAGQFLQQKYLPVFILRHGFFSLLLQLGLCLKTDPVL